MRCDAAACSRYDTNLTNNISISFPPEVGGCVVRFPILTSVCLPLSRLNNHNAQQFGYKVDFVYPGLEGKMAPKKAKGKEEKKKGDEKASKSSSPSSSLDSKGSDKKPEGSVDFEAGVMFSK